MKTKSSGKMTNYETGARRDVDESKPSFDDIELYEWEIFGGLPFNIESEEDFEFEVNESSDIEFMGSYAKERFQALMIRGAEKYGLGNWELGMPLDRYFNSALRHLVQWRFGDTTEDHLAAVIFNVMGAIETEKRIKDGELSKEFVKDTGVLRHAGR